MIRTARLLLRPFSIDDAGWVAREIADPEVQRWLHSVPHPYALSDAEGYIEDRAEDPLYKVIEKDGTPLGAVTIDLEEGPDVWPELGFWLSLRAHRQGVMTEAAAALVAHYFATTQGTGLGSGYIEGNHASARVQEKLGFEPTGASLHAHSRILNKPVRVFRTELTRAAWQDVRPGARGSSA